MLARRLEEGRTHNSLASLISYMGLVLIPEVPDGAEDRVWGRLAESAERGIFDDTGHFLEEFNISFLAFPATDVIKDNKHLS